MIIYHVEKELDKEDLKEHPVKKNLPNLTTSEATELEGKIFFRQGFGTKEGKVNWIVQAPGKF